MRTLTSEEIRQLEIWARKTQISKMLSFFDDLPRFTNIPQPLLLGSNNDSEILVVGDTTIHRIRQKLRNLDEPFNPHLKHQRILGGVKRDKPEKALNVLFQELKKGFAKTCVLEDTGQCGDKIIRAHSLQKSVFKNHAKNGHVYQFEPFTGTHDSEENLWPDLVGINNATTFLGFCEWHDSQIFASIENSVFQNSHEQIFLHHYRAFAQMYYDKGYKFQMIEKVYNALAQKYDSQELKTLAEKVFLNRHDFYELKRKKPGLDKLLHDRKWDAVEGYAFIGEKMPDILTTNFFAPRKDFHGQILQDTKSLAPLKWVSFTVTATNDCSLFLLVGDRGCPVLRQLVESFREMPLQTMAIVAYVFCVFENFIILPKWWESLSESARQKFVNAFQGRYYRRELPNSTDWKLKHMAP